MNTAFLEGLVIRTTPNELREDVRGIMTKSTPAFFSIEGIRYLVRNWE